MVYRLTALLTLVFTLALGCGAAVDHDEYVPSQPSPAEVEWERCHQLERDGQTVDALACYQSQCAATPVYERSCYDRSRLLYAAGRTAEGRAATAEFLVRFPGNPLCQPAAKRLGRDYRTAGAYDAGAAELGRLAAATAGTDAEDSIRYELARLHREAGQLEAEVSELEAIVELGRWESQLWDDALWRLIEIQREQGRPSEEERLVRKLIATREEARLIGRHNSPFLDDAQLRLGQLLLERGEHRAAYRAFMDLWGWETSRMRDDGLLWAAKTRIEQGRTKDACKQLGKLLDKIPDGRRCAKPVSWSVSSDVASAVGPARLAQSSSSS